VPVPISSSRTPRPVRDAPNRGEVLDAVQAATGIRLGMLSGVEEAQLTFLAARRWLGWRTVPMLMLDIGGGTPEVAFGPDRLPDSALSLPLGAGRLTRQFLRDGDPPPAAAVRRLRGHVRSAPGPSDPRGRDRRLRADACASGSKWAVSVGGGADKVSTMATSPSRPKTASPYRPGWVGWFRTASSTASRVAASAP
jgi:exopolyphosphatase/pppGpp-phosphohydrolase